MSPDDLVEKLRSLGGRTPSSGEIDALSNAIPDDVFARVMPVLRVYPLIQAGLSLEKSSDRSGLGVELQGLTPEQMIDEAKEAYPGVVAMPLGYFPIGMCLKGSGDPYFLRLNDQAVVRIPHTAALGEALDEGQVELVAESLESLVARSE